MKTRRICLPVRLALILIVGIAVGFALLLAVYALPTAPMARHLAASIPALNGEWSTEQSYEQLVPGYQTTQLDNSTDAAMLLAAVHESDLPLPVRVAESMCYTSGGNAFATLLLYGEEGPGALAEGPIARYWHGYLVLLKPLLLALSYLDIRMLLTLAQGALLCAVLMGLHRRGLGRIAPAFCLSLLALTPTATALSMQFSTVLCVFLIAMVCLLRMPPRVFEGQGLSVFFLLVGMCTSYVDYLTYPVAAFGMPFITCVFLFPRRSAAEEWKRLVLCGACWCLGYFGMWAGKWLIAGLFGNELWFWQNLLAKITERSSGAVAEEALGYGDVLRAVVGVFAKRAYLLAAVAVLMAAGLTLWRRGGLLRPTAREAVVALVALLPFAWYLCTRNHSYSHAFFTSRGLCVTLYALGSLFCALLPQKTLQRGKGVV